MYSTSALRGIAAALFLTASTTAHAATVIDWITQVDRPSQVSDFDAHTLLALTFNGSDTYFRIDNNRSEDGRLRLDRSMEFIVCDGSVRVASGIASQCDGSVTPQPQGVLQLSLSATFNPSVSMAGIYWDKTATGNQNFGLVAGAGLSFGPGTTMEGLFTLGDIRVDQMASQTEVISPLLDPVQSIAVRTAVPDRNFYLIGQVDGDIIHTSAKDDTPIAQGDSRDFTPDTPSAPYTCQFCTTFYAGLGFASPGQGGLRDPDTGAAIFGTRTQFAVTFKVNEVPPSAAIPLPASLPLLLGGIGLLGWAGARRRKARS